MSPSLLEISIEHAKSSCSNVGKPFNRLGPDEWACPGCGLHVGQMDDSHGVAYRCRGPCCIKGGA